MPPLDYLALRLIRRHAPRWLVGQLSRRRLLIKPGLETLNPRAAADRFCAMLAARGLSLSEARVLLFGYGGRLGVAVELLGRGARHVVLLDPYADPHDARDLALARGGASALREENGRIVPDPAVISIVHEPAEAYAARRPPAVDIVMSNSVLEHVGDVDSALGALARITAPEGYHLHLVDLRDHFFRRPFEMLCYSERTWRLLDPPTHLNRWRPGDYERAFRRCFDDVSCVPTTVDAAGLAAALPRIRSEFLTGDPQLDAVTSMAVFARRPRPAPVQ